MSFALALALLAFQDPAEELKKEAERLRKENADLREMIQLLEKQTLTDAQEMKRLKQALSAVEEQPRAADPEPVNGRATRRPEGPVEVLKGKVLGVNAKMGFVLISLGERHGVKPGYRFEILREEFDNGTSKGFKKVAVGECEKFIQGDSKIRIVDGNAAQIRVEDEAVAIRHLAPVDAAAPSEAAPAAPASAKPGVYQITGRAGQGFAINYGTADGAKQTDVVFVYKDGKFKARLRLDTVQSTFSAGNIIKNSDVAFPDVGDQVYLQEIRKAVIGRVRINEEPRGIFIDIGAKNYGIKIGHRFEVRRAGKKVGVVAVQTTLDYGCWARPETGTRREDVQLGDFVELIEEK